MTGSESCNTMKLKHQDKLSIVYLYLFTKRQQRTNRSRRSSVNPDACVRAKEMCWE